MTMSPSRTKVDPNPRTCALDFVQEAMKIAGNFTFCKEFYVTTAQILALNATPVTLLAAPGAGRAIIFKGAVLFLDYNSAAYAGIAAGEDLAIRYTDGSGQIVGECEVTGFLDQTNDETRYVYPIAPLTSPLSSIEPVANAALVLHMLVGEITTGDSPLKLQVFYSIVQSDLSYIDSTYTQT